MGEAAKTAEDVPVNKATGKSYVSNFEGEEVDGRRYALGEGIDAGVDGGTIKYLTSTGRITELGPNDAPSTAGGSAIEMPPRDVSTMSRVQLLVELASGESDDELRRAVERKREAETASREGGGGFDAEAFVDRNIDDISDDELKALTPEQLAEVRAAEVENRNRSTLLERIDAAKPSS